MSKQNFKQYIAVLLTVIGFIISMTLYVSARPDRSEIRQMINDRVLIFEKKIDNLTEKIDRLDKYLMENKK